MATSYLPPIGTLVLVLWPWDLKFPRTWRLCEVEDHGRGDDPEWDDRGILYVTDPDTPDGQMLLRLEDWKQP